MKAALAVIARSFREEIALLGVFIGSMVFKLRTLWKVPGAMKGSRAVAKVLLRKYQLLGTASFRSSLQAIESSCKCAIK